MSSVLALMVITVYIEMVPGIQYNILTVGVQRGEQAVLKCPHCGSRRTWLGPDVNNSANGTTLIYFSNYIKNPLLNQSNKYFVQADEGNYDLNILNFQKEDTGVYLCRFLNKGTFNENKYNVLLLEYLSSTTMIYIEGRNTAPDNTSDWATDSILLKEDNRCICNWSVNNDFWKVSGSFVGGIIVCLICSNVYCYMKHKKASKDILDVPLDVQYDEISTSNYNIGNIETGRDDTRDRMTVMHLSGINIDTLFNKSPTLSYSSTIDSLSRKTEGSENTYESINLDQNHEFKM
ncbi:uncharacterized protein LOC134701295 [Mytilus trossulus]|uniref:uncharacterized protein LOC134701295 n=1 Tax=Mytilus trossulus TaxID=6551 RepID=UPI003004F474